MALDDKEFRRVMGLFTTGVAVICAEADGREHAMTANAVCSVSLHPPLVLFCPGRAARFASLLPTLKRFSINFLRAEQQALSTYFAGGWGERAPPPFRFVRERSTPRLEGALATLWCRRHAVHEAGDHWLVLGEVTAVRTGIEPHLPLLFYRGHYRRLDAGEGPSGPDLATADEPATLYHE